MHILYVYWFMYTFGVVVLYCCMHVCETLKSHRPSPTNHSPTPTPKPKPNWSTLYSYQQFGLLTHDCKHLYLSVYGFKLFRSSVLLLCHQAFQKLCIQQWTIASEISTDQHQLLIQVATDAKHCLLGLVQGQRKHVWVLAQRHSKISSTSHHLPNGI